VYILLLAGPLVSGAVLADQTCVVRVNGLDILELSVRLGILKLLVCGVAARCCVCVAVFVVSCFSAGFVAASACLARDTGLAFRGRTERVVIAAISTYSFGLSFVCWRTE